MAGVRARRRAPAGRRRRRRRGSVRRCGSARRARAPGGATSLLVGLLLVEAAVTAVLNLDTAGLEEGAFLYGAVFMANAGSLLLPGSNLTNLIVLAHEHVSGSTFAARLAPAWVVSVTLTIAFVAVVFRRSLAVRQRAERECALFPPRAGTVGVAAAAALVLVLADPALPVLGLGVATALAARLRPRAAARAANPVR